MSWKPNPQALKNFHAAFGEYARAMKKDNPDGIPKLMQKAARVFVREMADVTPPAQIRAKNPDIKDDKGLTGADSTAKKRGENAIVSDLLKLAQPVDGITRSQARGVLSEAQDLLDAHARAVNGVGRVNPRNRKQKLQVLSADFTRISAMLGKRVGFLAAGLNAAASKLGFSLPAWISRHGTKFGIIQIEFTASRFFIRIGQNVPYASNVKGYGRAFNYAFAAIAKSLQREIHGRAGRLAEKAKAHIK